MEFLSKLGAFLEQSGDWLFVNGGFRGKNDKEIDNDIAQLALLLVKGEKEEFDKEAQHRAKGLNINDLPYIRLKFHQYPNVPDPTINKNDLGFGTWMALCQQASFELLYNYEKPPIDFIRSIAFGVYDWTQANALVTLCRYYLDGKLSHDIIEEIDSKMEDMRYEAVLYFAQDLLKLNVRHPIYNEIITSITNETFKEALAELLDTEK